MVMLPCGWALPENANVDGGTFTAEEIALWVSGERVFDKALYYTNYPNMSDITIGYTVFLSRLKSGNILLQDYYESGAKYSEPYQVESFYKDSRSPFRQDALTGIFICYTESGQKFSETHYRGGMQHGVEIIWYGNGQKATEGRYYKGTSVGAHMTWEEDGTLVDVMDYGDSD